MNELWDQVEVSRDSWILVLVLLTHDSEMCLEEKGPMEEWWLAIAEMLRFGHISPKLVCKRFIKKVFPGKTKKEEKQDREETAADQV